MKTSLLIAILIYTYITLCVPSVFGVETEEYINENYIEYSEELDENIFKSPSDLEKYMNERFIYIRDLNGYTKNTEELFNDNGGDCEDLAVFAYRELYKIGYSPQALIMWNDNTGHVVTVFKEYNGNLSFFSNLEYIQTSFTNIILLRTKFFPLLKNYMACGLDGKSMCSRFLNGEYN